MTTLDEEHLALFDSALDPLDRRILTMRFGLNGQNPMTLQAIADILRAEGRKVTRERARQLQNVALSKLRIAIWRLEDPQWGLR